LDWESVAGIATLYGLNGPGIEFRFGGEIFYTLQNYLGYNSPSYTMGAVTFPSVKRQGFGFDYPPTSSAAVKERIELYLYSPSGSS
jgi:hypothetical protein